MVLVIRIMELIDFIPFRTEFTKAQYGLTTNDFQVWIEKMDESGEVGVFIEEGCNG